MRVPLEWLREYVDYGDRSPEEVAELFSSSGTEVEQVLRTEFDPAILVAEILEVRPHPGADRLQLATVRVGRKKLEVVCGAPNIAVGQKVPLAQPGTTIQGQILQAVEIRGVKSEGMLLSARELGISDDHSGIVVLPEDARSGQSAGEALSPAGGVVLDLARIQPNRPDKFGMIGLARELAAVLRVRTGKGTLREPRVSLREADQPARGVLSVQIEHQDDCSAYLARIVEFDPGQAAPAWMAMRLEAAGSRSRSLAVDVTNYVMLETAQPLHAFDADAVRGQIRVRRAKKGERIVTLDSVERTLSPEILVIADEEGPIAIAGVLGGARCEVRETTRRVVVESANFDKTLVRKGALSLGLRTDASTRFEKGLPVSLAAPALDRAAALIVEHGGGVVWRGVVGEAPTRERSHRIRLGLEVAEIGGMEVSPSETKRALEAVGCEVASSPLQVTVPPWRPDLAAVEDLVEEVIRLVGYDALPSELPAGRPAELVDPRTATRRRLQEILVGAGAYEVKTYSFVSLEMIERLGLSSANHLKLENPKSAEQAYMRSELVSRLLEVLALNRYYSIPERRGVLPPVFELAHVFRAVRGERKYEEHEELCALILGEGSLGRVKGLLELVGKRLGVSFEVVQGLPAELWWHPGRYGEIRSGSVVLGQLGEVHPRVRKAWKLSGRVAVLRLDWPALLDAVEQTKREYRAIPRFPETLRDVSFDVALEASAALLRAAALDASEYVTETSYRAIFDAPGLQSGQKQVLLGLRIGADRTLETDDIEAVVKLVQARLKQRFKAKIRD